MAGICFSFADSNSLSSLVPKASLNQTPSVCASWLFGCVHPCRQRHLSNASFQQWGMLTVESGQTWGSRRPGSCLSFFVPCIPPPLLRPRTANDPFLFLLLAMLRAPDSQEREKKGFPLFFNFFFKKQKKHVGFDLPRKGFPPRLHSTQVRQRSFIPPLFMLTPCTKDTSASTQGCGPNVPLLISY